MRYDTQEVKTVENRYSVSLYKREMGLPMIVLGLYILVDTCSAADLTIRIPGDFAIAQDGIYRLDYRY